MQVRSGKADRALATVASVSKLINTDPKTMSLRRRTRRPPKRGGSAARGRRTLEEMTRAGQLEDLLGVVSDVVAITTVPTPSVCNKSGARRRTPVRVSSRLSNVLA